MLVKPHIWYLQPTLPPCKSCGTFAPIFMHTLGILDPQMVFPSFNPLAVTWWWHVMTPTLLPPRFVTLLHLYWPMGRDDSGSIAPELPPPPPSEKKKYSSIVSQNFQQQIEWSLLMHLVRCLFQCFQKKKEILLFLKISSTDMQRILWLIVLKSNL